MELSTGHPVLRVLVVQQLVCFLVVSEPLPLQVTFQPPRQGGRQPGKFFDEVAPGDGGIGGMHRRRGWREKIDTKQMAGKRADAVTTPPFAVPATAVRCSLRGC